MIVTSQSPTIDPADWAFHFDTGRTCLDFTATMGDRSGVAFDRWRGAGDLARWCGEAGYTPPPSVTEAEFSTAKNLREAIYRLVSAARSGKKPKPLDIALLNDWASKPVAAPQISDDARHISWKSGKPLESVLATVARDAIDLLTGSDLGNLRECAEQSCSVLFVDHSRPGKRRWCSMSRCGNRVKKATFRGRVNQPAS